MEEMKMQNIACLDFLDVKTALANMGGSEKIYIAVVEEYIGMYDNFICEIKKAFSDNDYETYIIKVHALKGNSASIGAMDMSEHAKRHEMAGKEGRYDYILDDFHNLVAEYDELVRKITAAMEESCIDSGKENDFTDENIVQRLSHILENIEEYEVDDAEEEIKELLSCNINSKIENILNDVLAQMQNFEYDVAADMLRNLI